MNATFRILIAVAVQSLLATAEPVGICLHAYSPEAPADKIESFEFEKVERAGDNYRFFPRSNKSVVVTAYRFRGTILYKSNLRPSHPEFDKLLKLYEETARATPSTRVFLNHRILTMRTQSAQATKQLENVAALPTITLADGSKLIGCRMTKIDKDVVSIMHQGGIRKVDIKELDDTEKKALTTTSDSLSLEDPSITSKDPSGTFAQIVFKNGVVLKNAKFKEVAGDNLVFMADGKSVPIPLDQFPTDLSLLGEEVVKTLTLAKEESIPVQSVASSEAIPSPAVPVETESMDNPFGGEFVLPGEEETIVRETSKEDPASEGVSNLIGMEREGNEVSIGQQESPSSDSDLQDQNVDSGHLAEETATKISPSHEETKILSDDSYASEQSSRSKWLQVTPAKLRLLLSALVLAALVGLILTIIVRSKSSKTSGRAKPAHKKHRNLPQDHWIKFACPDCETHISKELEFGGKSVDCPMCGKDLIVPAAFVEVADDLPQSATPATVRSLPPVPGARKATLQRAIKIGASIFTVALVLFLVVPSRDTHGLQGRGDEDDFSSQIEISSRDENFSEDRYSSRERYPLPDQDLLDLGIEEHVILRLKQNARNAGVPWEDYKLTLKRQGEIITESFFRSQEQDTKMQHRQRTPTIH